MKLEIYIYIIDKEDNKRARKIYKANHETYFEEVTLFTDEFIEHSKRNPNLP